MTDLAKQKQSRKSISIAALAAGIIFPLVVLFLKLVSPNLGWAALDAKLFHFPVINYFIDKGIDLNYPPGLVMFPGMHAIFATVARLLRTGPLAFDGWPAFAIQSGWGLAYTAAVVQLFKKTAQEGQPDAAWLLPMFCSSYPIYSWLWPTTDIGAYFCLFAMTLVAWDVREITLYKVTAFTVLAVVGTLFRQNYAVVSLGLFAGTILRDPLNIRHARLGPLALTLVPVALVAVLITFFIYIWGDVVPAGIPHGSMRGINFVPLDHTFALTGLIAWPFILVAAKALRPSRRMLAVIGALSVVAAVASQQLLFSYMASAAYDREANRPGSLVWTLLQHVHGSGLDVVLLLIMLTVGFGIWLTVLFVCWREKSVPSEIVLFGLFLMSFLFQSMPWQRYVEVIILVTISVFFGRRVILTGALRWLVIGWFGLYAVLTLVKAGLGLSASPADLL